MENNLSKFDFLSTFNSEELEGIEADTRYTTKVSVPQYLPKNVCPDVRALCNTAKYDELMNEIYESNVTEEEKKFLQLAATRHLVFTYSLIADYYAHASKEMQELMEKSALVLIDIDDAIANGYVRLSKTIENIMVGGKSVK